MAQSSEDGIDRDSREYTRGYLEALDAVLQRLHNLQLQSATRGAANVVVRCRDIVQSLRIGAADKADRSKPKPTVKGK